MIDAVSICLNHLDKQSSEIGSVCRRPDLIVDDRQFVSRLAQPKHRPNKILAVDAEHPRYPNDEKLFEDPFDRFFARELRSPVRISRSFRRVDFVRQNSVAREDIIRADVQEFDVELATGFCNRLDRARVHRHRQIRLVFRSIDCSVGSAMNDRVRFVFRYELPNARRVCQIKIPPRGSDCLCISLRQLAHHIETELPRYSRYHYFHDNFSS